MSSRGAFSNKLGFILAAAGSAVGLGNIWRFPYEVGLGGGAAFLMMYLIFCFVLCLPVMVTEIAIGRKTQKNAAGAFVELGFKRWKALGIFGILCGVIILSFYNVIAGWAFGYFFEMASGNFEIANNFGGYISDIVKVGGYGIIFILATAFVVSRGVSGGIEKLAKKLMPTLIVMILALVGYSFTLPNAMKGVEFYLVPDLSELNAGTIGGALRHAFFSLSLGMGALITYGSYLSKNENIITAAAQITLMDVGIAFIAGLMIFPLVAFNNGGDMSTVADDQAGPGLIFVTLPEVFKTIGSWGNFVGAFFFLLLSVAALTSTVSLLEVPVSYVIDEFRVKRGKAVIIMAVIVFVIGIPSLLSGGYSQFFSSGFKLPGLKDPDFITFFSGVADSFLLLGGFLIVTFGAYVWKKDNLNEELAKGYPGFQ
ncbi:MAG: sodium-dependent transporter, partial [Cytophagales bacterium]|nr:sodium-dependent transporter [Cytophagales bacterium]